MARIVDEAKEIRRMWSAFQSSRVLITANNFRVFDYLTEAKTALKLSKIIRTDTRATGILLDALTSLGFLIKQKDKYRNSHTASRFLVSDSPYYQGDIIKHVDVMWSSWSNLDKVMKTGRPARGARNHEAFILGMHNLSVLKVEEIIKNIGLSGVRKALDLGGGPGTYSIGMAKRGIHVTLFDDPETERIADRVIKRSGVDRGNIEFMAGDFLKDEIGRNYDLILMSQIVHAYSEKNNIMLFRKCRKALNRGGRLVIQEFLIDEKKTAPAWSALFAINMLVNTEGGRTYSPGEMKAWFLKAGFKNIRKKIVSDGVLVSGRK